MPETKEASWLPLLPSPLRAHLRGRNSLQAMIANSGWLLFDKFVRLAMGLLVGAWVARYLGPSQFGQLAYVLAYVAFFQSVANLGADGIIVRDIARAPEAAAQILGTAFVLRLMAGMVCWLAAVGGMAWLYGVDDPNVIITMLAGGTLVFQAADTIDLWFQSQSQSRRTVAVKLITYLLSNGIKVWLILIKASLFAFAAVMAFDTLVAALGLAVAYRLFPAHGRWKVVMQKGKQLLVESWTFMLSGLSIIVYIRIDQIMLKEMLGERELGIYAVGITLSQIWQFIPMTLTTSIAPFVSKKKQESEKSYIQTLVAVFRLYAGLGLVVSIVTAALSGVAITLIYGELYSEAIPVLAIHAFTNVFINLGVAQGLWMVNEGYGRLSMYQTLTGVAICITCNFLLIPLWGVIGAATAAVLAQLGAAVASNIFIAPSIFRMQLMALLQMKSAH
jgi:O-antigen/teichoic acid export membrane protein